MQERTTWYAPTGALGRLTAAAYERAARLIRHREALEARAAVAPVRPGMAEALLLGDRVAVIAEIKRRSPSKGAINESIDAPARARAYANAGARAISVLTEPSEFGGSADDLDATAAAVVIPLLKKDFHVDAVQLLEARAHGASAALLIARALPADRLVELSAAAFDLGVEPLIEVRSEEELDVALSTRARMIGVNARDLETLVIEPGVVERLLPLIPRDRVAIAESGLGSRADVERVAAWGARAVLIGSSLSLAADPGATLAELAGVRRA
ncbi:MAG: indole-3-glycerol-phosphate synthase [Cytophagaceae bacterium]|nr:indole-3-glycerol-phosphate synthase [Gemmatimonadaceae bacterium]